MYGQPQFHLQTLTLNVSMEFSFFHKLHFKNNVEAGATKFPQQTYILHLMMIITIFSIVSAQCHINIVEQGVLFIFF